MSTFLNSPDTWVILGLVLFFAVLGYFGVHRTVIGILDKRADDIRARIREAAELREAAARQVQQLQEQLARDRRNAEAAVEAARQEAEAMRAQELKSFQATLERRVAAGEERIRQAEVAAEAEIRNAAIDVAVAAAARILEDDLTAAERNAATEHSIQAVRKQLNSGLSDSPSIR